MDASLEQYDEASICPPIFANLCGYPGKWACTLDEGKDISAQDLLMHMEKTLGNKHDYDAMIRTLYEVQQKEDETVEEYMREDSGEMYSPDEQGEYVLLDGALRFSIQGLYT